LRLENAVWDDDPARVQALLEGGADPDARWCPFESRGASDTSCRSSDGTTPLILAANLDLADITYLLLEAGADPRKTSFGA
jgi:ankyrin repeat protein